MPGQTPRSLKRDHLLNTALQLFSKEGYRATGIDKIIAESGVAKMTLYKHFKSKDELIIAVLNKRDEDFNVWLLASMAKYIPQQQGDPRLYKLFALFDALDEWFNSDTFYGCNFINASIEFKHPEDPIHQVAAAHKVLMIKNVQQLLEGLHLADTLSVARQIHMMIEGSIIMAITIMDKNAAKLAKQSVFRLLASYDISPPLNSQMV